MRIRQSYREAGEASRQISLLDIEPTHQDYDCSFTSGDPHDFYIQTGRPYDGRIFSRGATLVKLILRNKEYEVKPGMTLLSALGKINVVPESVIATRDGEMILDDEILKDGEVIKLIAVISGGACHCDLREPISLLRGDCFVATNAPRNDREET